MKKTVLFTLIAAIALASGVYPQERADVVESITPSSAILFVKTSRIRNFLVSLKYVTDNLLAAESAEKLGTKSGSFKNRTGVDLLDAASLEKAGIDVNRSVSLAMYPNGKQNEERILVFIPVMDEKTFPLKFVEVLRKAAPGSSADVYPVITEYRDYTMYQIRRDVFTTALDGVFVIGSTGEIVRSVIDAKVNNAGHLAVDPNYIDSLTKNRKNYDLRAYATRDLLKDVMKGMKKPGQDKKENEKEKSGDRPVSMNGQLLREAVYYGGAAGAFVSMESEMNRLSSGPSLLNAVDYAFLGASVKPTAVDIDLAARFNRTSGTVNTFLDVIKTGKNGRALSVKNATANIFASLDFGKIEELCRNNGPGCDLYASFKEQVKNDLGLDFQADVMPSFSGVMNLVAGEPKGAGSGYALYLPMDDAARSGTVLEKAAAYLREKYRGTERFGTVTIGGNKAYWYYGAKSGKTFIARDRRGLYMGNDAELMAAAMAGKESSTLQIAGGAVRKVDDNVFFLTFLKKESFFGAILSLYGNRSKDVGGFVDRMQDLTVISRKIDDYVTLDITISLMKRK